MSVDANMYPLNETDYIAEDAQLFHSTRTQGVFSSDIDFLASPAGGMSVLLSEGQGWIDIERFKGMSFALKTPAIFTADISDQTLKRIDRILFRYDYVFNQGFFLLRKGTPGSNPQPPALENIPGVSRELGLKDLHIDAGIAEVTSGQIQDLIPDEVLCGVMRDAVTRIPTQQLQDQARALIQVIEQELADINAGTAVMLRAEFAGENYGVVRDSERLGGMTASEFTGNFAPRAGNFAFEGPVVVPNTNSDQIQLRNIVVQTSAGVAVSTGYIIGRRV